MLRRLLGSNNNSTSAEIYWECNLCGFDNNVNSEATCILCGTQNSSMTSTAPIAISGISDGDGSNDVRTGRESNANVSAAAGADTIVISEDAQIQVVKYSSFSLSERQRQVAQNYRRLNKVSGLYSGTRECMCMQECTIVLSIEEVYAYLFVYMRMFC